MKKSYHSTVVPTTVANRTRRSSRLMPLPGSGCGEVLIPDSNVWLVTACGPVAGRSVRRGHGTARPWQLLGRCNLSIVATTRWIIYDPEWNARASLTGMHLTASARARRLMNTDQDPRFAGLPGRPGKIVAVHLSYGSRADQRGRRPAAPSYFFKPASSVAPGDAQITRPHETGLLAFEGEIALAIGRHARWVDAESAWAHVAWVTAANDFGLYDLRANDKGSNGRSKGRDGYTPIGVDLIDARQIDPAHLRVRTWVNETLAQEGGTEDLIFPLGQFVADLSQHLTLEPGDVILTGTPAGSSVVQPGDTVEVEVDSPATGHSSGRLRTTVAQDDAHAFDPEVGSLPSVDDAQRIAAWGSEEAAGLDRRGLHRQLREKLQRTPVATLSQQLRRRGLNNVSIDGVGPLPGSGKI